MENKDFDLKLLQSTWNLFLNLMMRPNSLEKVMEGELDNSSSRLCGFKSPIKERRDQCL